MFFLEDDKECFEMVKVEEGCLNMIFIFEIMGFDIIFEKGCFSFKFWCVDDLRKIINKLQVLMYYGWVLLFCENYD